MQLCDREITQRALYTDMISPFVSKSTKDLIDGKPLPSYGLSSYGYDVRVQNKFKMLKPQEIVGSNKPISLLKPLDNDYVDLEAIDGRLIIPPHGFVLAHTVEYFKIPRDIFVICMGKSTYARLGLVVNVTPLEPEWEGEVVVEISNTTSRAVEIYTAGGIAQFVFLKHPTGCDISYADRQGKYQKQTGIKTAC